MGEHQPARVGAELAVGAHKDPEAPGRAQELQLAQVQDQVVDPCLTQPVEQRDQSGRGGQVQLTARRDPAAGRTAPVGSATRPHGQDLEHDGTAV